MLELRQLTKLYRGMPGVRNVSLQLAPGEILGYVGPNGSGKSTTIKMLTGLINPTSGAILFRGESVSQDFAGFKSHVGYIPEEPHLYGHLSGLEYLTLVGRLRGLKATLLAKKADAFLSLLDLHESRFSAIASYSKGMRQRILIAAALLADPQLIILDEPFSGLDVNAAVLFRRLLMELARNGRMILFSSHVLEVVEKLCSQVVILYRGDVVAQDSIDGLRTLLALPSLMEVFAQLTKQQDQEVRAREIVEVMCLR